MMRHRSHSLPADAGAEAALTSRAVEGDRAAFAALYELYERRVYNLCLRIVGSPEEAADSTQEAFVSVLRRLPKLRGRELNFGAYLFTAARHASYDAVKRRGAQLTDAVPDSAVPVRGDMSAPVRAEEDPARNVLLQAQQESLRAANARLPERHREVLALRELGELSYDEIASAMGMNRNSVAQLLSRARTRLRAELRGTAGATVAPADRDCERALPLLAMADDGELRDADKARWLEGHLSGCSRCQVAQEVMAEAGESYRSWAPLAVAPWLLDEVWAEAAERARARQELRRRRGMRALAAVGVALLVSAMVAARSVDSGDPAVAAQGAPERAQPERTPSPAPTAVQRRRAPKPRQPEPARTPEAKRPAREPVSTPAPTRTPTPSRTPDGTRAPEPTPTPEAAASTPGAREPQPTPTPSPEPPATPETPTATPTPTPTVDCSHRAGGRNRCPEDERREQRPETRRCEIRGVPVPCPS